MADTLQPTIESKSATLSLSDVRLPMADLRGGELFIDLTADAGDLAMLAVGEIPHVHAIADIVCGLRQPDQGSVRFQGQDWTASPPDFANARRGRIGCMLDDSAWLSHLSLTDNILLPTLYHTRQPRDSVLTEATRLARQFGFIGLPMGLPDDYGETDLRRAAFVRAFLGKPDMILLASQASDFAPNNLARLLNVMRQARDAGAVILWFMPEDLLNADVMLPDSRRYSIQGNRLVEDIVS